MMSCLSVTGNIFPNYEHIIYLQIVAVKCFFKKIKKIFNFLKKGFFIQILPITSAFKNDKIKNS